MTLFVPLDQVKWGTFDPAAHQATLHDQRQPGDQDLLDQAALQTLLHEGEVFAVPQDQMPFGHTIVAAYRY